jgi:hypothetical protein
VACSGRRCDKDCFDEQLAALERQQQGTSNGSNSGSGGGSDATVTLPWPARTPKALGRFPATCPRFNGYYKSGGALRQCAALALDTLSAQHPDKLDARKFGIFGYLAPSSYRKKRWGRGGCGGEGRGGGA